MQGTVLADAHRNLIAAHICIEETGWCEPFVSVDVHSGCGEVCIAWGRTPDFVNQS
jgi:hypothetical protein